MGVLSSYSASASLDHVLGTTTMPKPSAVYAQLHTGPPGAAGTSNLFGDTTRKSVAFTAAAAGSASMSGPSLWSGLSAAGTITHLSLWDAAVGGNCVAVMALTSGAQTASINNEFLLSALIVTWG